MARWQLTSWSLFFSSCVMTTSLIWRTISIKSLVTVVRLTAGNGWIERYQWNDWQLNIRIPFYFFRPRKLLQFWFIYIKWQTKKIKKTLLEHNVDRRTVGAFKSITAWCLKLKWLHGSVLVQWQKSWCSSTIEHLHWK